MQDNMTYDVREEVRAASDMIMNEAIGGLLLAEVLHWI